MSAPPALPPRKAISDSSNKESIPGQGNGDELADMKVSISVCNRLSEISVIGQQELYSSPLMNDSTDIFVNDSAWSEANRKRSIELIKKCEDADFWLEVMDRQTVDLITSKKIQIIEEKIIEGIPDSIRALWYLKVMQVKPLTKEGFNTLLKRANSYFSQTSLQNISSFHTESLNNVLKIYFYHSWQTNSGDSLDLSDSLATGTVENFDKFARDIANMLKEFNSVSDNDILYILLRLKKLYSCLSKGEFYYKINRSIEDLNPNLFKHLTRQGIDLRVIYHSTLENLFSVRDSSSIKLIDLVVLEGFDFIIRYIVDLMSGRSSTLLHLEGNELSEYFHSSFTEGGSLKTALEIEPNLIKYGNEYNLIHSNSFSKNQNELINLKESKERLMTRLTNLDHEIETLRKTHIEILDQDKELKSQLEDAIKDREKLTMTRDTLNEKYETNTMKENLKNTIKANREFSERNAELEYSISSIKKRINTKRTQLAKYA